MIIDFHYLENIAKVDGDQLEANKARLTNVQTLSVALQTTSIPTLEELLKVELQTRRRAYVLIRIVQRYNKIISETNLKDLGEVL